METHAQRRWYISVGLVVLSVVLAAATLHENPKLHGPLREFNQEATEELKKVRPVDLASAFNGRLTRSHYDVRIWNWSAPFNWSEAHRQYLRELLRLKANTPRRELAKAKQELDARYPNVVVNPPTSLVATQWWQRALETILGIPDAVFHTLGIIFSGGWTACLVKAPALLLALVVFAAVARESLIAAVIALPVAFSLACWLVLIPFQLAFFVFGQWLALADFFAFLAVSAPLLFLGVTLVLKAIKALLERMTAAKTGTTQTKASPSPSG